VTMSRFCFNDEPTTVAARMEQDPDSGVDVMTSAVLRFPRGHAIFTCSMRLAPQQRAQILGSKGHIDLPHAWNPASDRPSELVLETSDRLEVTAAERIEFPAVNQYTILAQLFARAAATGGPGPIPLEDSIKEVRKQIDNAKFLSLQYVLSFGVDKPEEYEHFFKVMSDAAAYADERKVKLVMKPHGGGSGASDEILRAIKTVNHRNFKIWYDAGNIIYYTGKDPIEELKPIAQHVTGFCAKDCPAVRGEVMSQFGTGKVDFAGVFKALKAAGFKGPVMVEGVKVGATPEETMANARANREFLEKVLATV